MNQTKDTNQQKFISYSQIGIVNILEMSILSKELVSQRSNSLRPECSPQGFSVHGISQARILEWVAVSFSRGSSRPRDQIRVFSLKVDSLPYRPPGKPQSEDCSPGDSISDSSERLHHLIQKIYKFNATLFKIPRVYFIELEQIILKVVANHKRS